MQKIGEAIWSGYGGLEYMGPHPSGPEDPAVRAEMPLLSWSPASLSTRAQCEEIAASAFFFSLTFLSFGLQALSLSRLTALLQVAAVAFPRLVSLF